MRDRLDLGGREYRGEQEPGGDCLRRARHVCVGVGYNSRKSNQTKIENQQ